jgi:hypothetical protein
MSQIFKAIFGGVAVTLALGAVQLASGHDLADRWQAVAGAPEAGVLETAINRSAKADRAAVVAGSAVLTRTIALRLDSLSDTSILVRVPVARETEKKPETEARNGPAAPSLFRSGDRKMAVACEPMVSVLTEVAKRLEPGRCVT